MKLNIYDHTGSILLRVEEAEPECGKDYCDRCGECLRCFGGDECWDGVEYCPEHFWVNYEDMEE